MTELSRRLESAQVPSVPEIGEEHPRALEPTVLILNIVMSVIGAIIGLQILTTLGVTPNTAIIGVLVALAVSRIPTAFFGKYRSIHQLGIAQLDGQEAGLAAKLHGTSAAAPQDGTPQYRRFHRLPVENQLCQPKSLLLRT